MTKRLVLGSIAGLFLAVLGGILAVVGASIIAFAQDTRVDLLGVFAVWADYSGAGRGLAFDPDFVGMAVVAAVVVVLGALVAAYAVPRKARGTVA